MTRRRLLCAAVLAGLVAVVPGCGGGGEGDRAGRADDTAPGARGVVSDDAGPATPVTVTAGDLFFKPAEVTVPAGTVEITLVNQGQLEHTLLVAGVRGLKLLVMRKGDQDTGRVTLDPGRYVFYCDVPGHRAAGMEARLVAE